MIVEFNGVKTFVGDGGKPWEAGLPSLVLVHGAGLDKTVWVLFGRYFARHGYNLIIPDLPGHADSEGELLVTIDAMGEWINQLMVSLSESHPISLDQVSYCGHSMGSLVTLHAASLNAQNVSKLVLLGTAVPMVVGDALLNAAKNNEHAAIDMVNFFGHSFESRMGNNPISGISIYNAAEALLEQAGDGVLYNDLNACNDYTDSAVAAMERVKGSAMQTTIVAGDSDRMTPLKMAKQAHQHVGGELLVLEQCGHMMLAEQPEATLRSMRHALL